MLLFMADTLPIIIMANMNGKEIVMQMALGRQVRYSGGTYRMVTINPAIPVQWVKLHTGSVNALIKAGTVVFDYAEGTTHYYKLAVDLSKPIEL